MHRPIPHPLAVAIFAGMLQLPAQAAPNAVDPGAYVPANGGFPAWYQDSHGRTLDLCLTKAVSSRVAGAPGAPAYMCTLLPTPGVFDDTQPIAFPTNFPDEAFWFTADAAIVDAARGIDRRKVDLEGQPHAPHRLHRDDAKRDHDDQHHAERATRMLDAYQAVRPLNAAERELLPAMLRAGALRFWISRLWDFYLPREASMLTPHDPTHFERVLRARLAHPVHA